MSSAHLPTGALSPEDRYRSTVLTTDWAAVIVAVTIGAAWIGWGVWGGRWLAAQFGHATGSTTALEAAGQFGDMFGGLNALFTAFAFVAVWWTGRTQQRELSLQLDELRLQRRALEMQRNELELQRVELADTRNVVSRQTFESMFFQMLRLVRDLHSEITYDPPSGMGHAVTGTEAMRVFASRCNKIARSAAGVVDPAGLVGPVRDQIGEAYVSQIYEHAEPYLGPYFRALYHVFRLIDDLDDPNESLKKRYANIARAQLSAPDIEVLAANGCSEPGEGFWPYIETYALLKHYPGTEGRRIYSESCYSSAAFGPATLQPVHTVQPNA